jgi:Flp pilus assembly protein TadG
VAAIHLRPRRGDRGLSTVQLAIAAPVLIWWLMATVQFGLWWHAKQMADGAAAEAVDVAQTPTGTAAAGEAAARSFLAETGSLANAGVVVERDDETVSAEVTGEVLQLVPGFSVSVTARNSAPVERFIEESER